MKFWFKYHVDIKKKPTKFKLKIYDSIRAWNFIEVHSFIQPIDKNCYSRNALKI